MCSWHRHWWLLVTYRAAWAWQPTGRGGRGPVLGKHRRRSVAALPHPRGSRNDFHSSRFIAPSPLRRWPLQADSVVSRARSSSALYNSASSVLSVLGFDSLTFLATTVAIVPLFKKLKVSPVLGFLAAGLIMGPQGFRLIKDLGDLNVLGEFGITFLLFEQGLELSLDRLKALSRYAFGLGTLQVILCTLAFTIFPFLGGVQFLEYFFGSPHALANITRVDEAMVIGAALSLSSSAFVLKILQEKGKLQEQWGRATLGVLLMQDIAVVPVLVLLPLVESSRGVEVDLLAQLSEIGWTALKAVGGLGALVLFGRTVLRRVFELVAGARSSETFVALCLLVAVGVGKFTEYIGLSSTLGAFAAGILLAETNYRTQIEADIAPFRGLLLGLFFVTTGASVDPGLILEQWPTVFGLLIGLLAFKSVIITGLGVCFGLSPAESARTGSILSGGGEFAFVVLTLAQRLGVLPLELNKLLVGMVVVSMALTPVLAYMGDRVATYIEEWSDEKSWAKDRVDSLVSRGGSTGERLVVICGFGPVGQIVASLISAPVVTNEMGGSGYVAFDLNPKRVAESRSQGFPVYYGDGSLPQVLEAAGITSPKALVVTYSSNDFALAAVKRLRTAFPTVPIVARAADYQQYWKLQAEGASSVVSDLSEISIRMGSYVIEEFGIARSDEIQSAKTQLRQNLAELAKDTGVQKEFTSKFSPAVLSPKTRASNIRASDLGVTVCLLPEDESDSWESSARTGSDNERSGEDQEDPTAGKHKVDDDESIVVEIIGMDVEDIWSNV